MASRKLNFFAPQRKQIRAKVSRKITLLSADPSPSRPVDRFTNEEILKKNPKISRLLHRPLPNLPRRHFLMLKCGPVPLADLSVPGPSIFDESKVVLPKIADPETVLPTEGRKGKKIVHWSKSDFSPIGSLSSSIGVPMASVSSSTGVPMASLSSSTGVPMASVSSSTGLDSVRGNLISLLREKAVAFGQTGIDPDLMDSVRRAMYSGLERTERFRECSLETLAELIARNASISEFNALVRRQDVHAAFATVEKMSQLGFACDQETFVSLIIATKFDAAQARTAFLEMRKKMISANEKIYAVLIRAHSADLAAGFSLLRKMESENIPLTSPIIPTILINGLVKTGQIKLAWEIFQNFRTWKKIQPDTVLFSVMIKACIIENECERALAVFEDLKLSNQFPTDVTYTHLIDCCSRREDFAEKAKDFWNQMQLEGFEMNAVVATSLLRVAALQGNIAALQKTVKEITNRNIPLTHAMYALAVNCAANSVNFDSSDFEKNASLRLAWQIVEDVRNKGLPVTVSLLNAVTRTYARCGHEEHALSMLEEFSKFEISPNNSTYSILLELLKDNPHKFFLLFDQPGLAWDSNILHLALDVAMSSKSSKRTVLVLEKMLGQQIYPLPDAAGKLAVVGRKIVQIHQIVGKLVAMNRDATYEETVKTESLIQLDIQEHRARLALEGKLDTDLTVEEEVRQQYFKKTAAPRLSKSEHAQVKKKGGETHAKKVDKIRHNILAE